jgi:hypothetical protein
MKTLGFELSKEEIRQIVKDVDDDGSGSISFKVGKGDSKNQVASFRRVRASFNHPHTSCFGNRRSS